MPMRALEITRYNDTGNEFIGQMDLVEKDGTLCRSYPCLERPDLNNEPSVSCIPTGQYLMKLGMYNRGGYPAYEVLDVEGRTLVKIHAANWVHQLLGCIAPGRKLGMLDGKMAVLASRVALNFIMLWAEGDKYMILRIREHTGPTL